MSETTIHDRELTERDWWSKAVDQRCRSCGVTSAGSSWCHKCGSKDVEYALHTEQMQMEGSAFWCLKAKPSEVHLAALRNAQGPSVSGAQKPR